MNSINASNCSGSKEPCASLNRYRSELTSELTITCRRCDIQKLTHENHRSRIASGVFGNRALNANRSNPSLAAPPACQCRSAKFLVPPLALHREVCVGREYHEPRPHEIVARPDPKS